MSGNGKTEVITSELNQNEQILAQILCPTENFDIIIRRIQMGGRSAILYYMDGQRRQKRLPRGCCLIRKTSCVRK